MAFALALTLCTMVGATNPNGISTKDAFDCQTYDVSVWDAEKECIDELKGESALMAAAWAATDLPEALTTYLRHWNLDGAQIDVKRLNDYDFKCERRSEAELP